MWKQKLETEYNCEKSHYIYRLKEISSHCLFWPVKGIYLSVYINSFLDFVGSGLGKNENGMKEAIKVKIKNDSHGV